ncbi:hypothetical protein OsccyDRAFT_0759 [Leptolyngbyaceae cyanobacterium JSC-12]|nr:hypothetical protein OsccyDRAFT_0759 [Leptolyngbyaceae cyanobacterium JSC-12]
MHVTRQSLPLLSAGIVLGLTSIVIPSAEAATLTWDLTFFDTTGNLVGTGEFSYDTEKVVVVRSPRPYSDAYVAGIDEPLRPDYIPPIPGLWQVDRYPNPLVSFIARLPGRDWSFSDLFLAWWDPNATGIVNSFGCSRAGCGLLGQWFAGSAGGFIPGQFVMFDGRPQSDHSVIGSFISAVIPTSPTSFTSGSWVAMQRSEAIPEPSTILGAIAFGTGWMITKLRKNQCNE